MRLSTKGRYGVRAMFELALHYRDGAVSLKKIAGQQEISEKYLEHLFASLKKAHLLVSTRGAQGGYQLARSPAEITVGDIVRVLEGTVSVSDCADDAAGGDSCGRMDQCVVHKVWIQVRDRINEVLDGITLEDMCEEHRQARQGGNMYYI